MTAIPLFARILGTGTERRIALRPLFAKGPTITHGRLDQAKDAMRSALEKIDVAPLQALGPLQELSLHVRCDLRDRTEQGRIPAVAWLAGGTRFAMLATWPAWYVTLDGGDPSLRVSRLLERRLLEDDAPAFADLVVKRDTWIDGLDLSPRRRVRARSRLADLFGDRPDDGADELRKVGVDLDGARGSAGPCLGREEELERLRALLGGERRRAVVVTGATGVGKTALVQGLVDTWRRPDGQAQHRAWLVPPAALIAGMSVIGAWEQRLDAILRHIEKHDLLLVIDDLPGWQRTGISSANNLDAARVLRSWIERDRIRVVMEADDDVLATVRERDRALVELLEPLRLEPLAPAATRRVLVGLARHLEDRGARPVTPEVLASVIDAHRRHLPHVAAPGGPAQLLSAAAASGPGADPLTGLGLPADCGINRPLDAYAALRARLLDQGEALTALGDALALAAAAMADPERPILSLLFSGPSGVGKTEAAKALAMAAFGDEAALIRVDCNELVASGAAVRLTGDFLHPDGLLTGPVRRRPFAVILLDEIEKAHSEVHHLLLQLLGEGRLGDGEGRTVRFDRCIVIMTANILPAGRPGFAVEKSLAAGTPVDLLGALPGHFPPELVNRIDRVVAFRPLGPVAMRELARRACERVCRREGLQRRGILVEVDEALITRLARGPFDPALGARELHRAVEHALAAPLAELAAVRSAGRHPSVIRLGDGAPPQAMCVDLAPVAAVEQIIVEDRDAWRDQLLGEQERLDEERSRRCNLAMAAGAGAQELAWAYSLGDELAQLRRLLDPRRAARTAAASTATRAGSSAAIHAASQLPPTKAGGREGNHGSGSLWASYCAAENALDWLRSVSADDQQADDLDLGACAGQLALIAETLAHDDPSQVLAERVALLAASSGSGSGAAIATFAVVRRILGGLQRFGVLEVEYDPVDDGWVAMDHRLTPALAVLAGTGARRLAEALAGTWLHHDRSGGLGYAVISVRALGPGPMGRAGLVEARRRFATVDAGMTALGAIRGILGPAGEVVDPASGWIGRPADPPEPWARALLRRMSGGAP